MGEMVERFYNMMRRKDLYATQMEDGRYVCNKYPLLPTHIEAHLKGLITLGAYLLDEKGEATYAVFDADNDEDFKKLVDISGRMEEQGIPSYLEQSRRGGHMWIFFLPCSGRLAREFGWGLAHKYDLPKMEFYPKQDNSEGPGSLIRLPFGVHRKTGKRYGFLNHDGERLGTWMEQMEAFTDPYAVDFPTFEQIRQLAPEEHKGRIIYDSKIEDIRSTADAIAFIGQYVELKKTSSGAVGKCPFHADEHASFGVNARGNYWHCFAGCGGGDVISFYAKIKGIPYGQAIKELTK